MSAWPMVLGGVVGGAAGVGYVLNHNNCFSNQLVTSSGGAAPPGVCGTYLSFPTDWTPYVVGGSVIGVALGYALSKKKS